MTAMKAYREDGTEVRPGDTIANSLGKPAVFYAATRVTEPGLDGLIQVDDQYSPQYYARGYGLTVRYAEREPGNRTPVEKALALADTETENHYSALVALADAVRAQLSPAGDADELAAEAGRAARTMAPPVPGVTRNNGYTVFAVLPGAPASPGLLASWFVAAQGENGMTVTWTACAGESGMLSYSGGRYQDNRALAMISLADRAGVFMALDSFTSGMATRERMRETRDAAISQLVDNGVPRARARTMLMNAAALGSSTTARRDGVSWLIRYDRVRCEFTVSRTV